MDGGDAGGLYFSRFEAGKVTLNSKHRRILGDNIRSVRSAEGLSESRLGHLVDHDTAFIRRVEAGGENIPFDTLVAIAKVLKIQVHDLTAGN